MEKMFLNPAKFGHFSRLIIVVDFLVTRNTGIAAGFQEDEYKFRIPRNFCHACLEVHV
jgi:hypothetical protein